MSKKAKKNLVSKILPFLIIFLFSFPAFKSLLKPGFYDTHDGLQHLERFIHFQKAIKAGQIIPRWASDAFAGYGTPIFNFNWNLPYYLGFFLHLLGISYPNVFKIFMFISIPLSGFFMFLWLRKKIGQWPAITSAIFYIYTPYRFLDIYVRGALGEALAFVFIPLIFWSLDNSSKKKFFILGSLSFAVLILTHNAFALIMLLVYASYTFLLKDLLLPKIKTLFFGLGLSSFLWIPAILESRFMNYPTFSQKNLSFVPFLALIRSKWEGGSVFNGQKIMMSFQIGLAQLLILFLVVLLLGWKLFFKKKKIKDLKLVLFFLSWFFITLFFLAEISKPVWLILPLFKNFVFAFRMLFLIVLTTAVLAGLLIKKLRFKALISLLFILLVIFANRNHLRSQPQSLSMESLAKKASSLDIGGEFLPKWTKIERLKELRQEDRQEIEIIKGNAEVLEILRLPLQTQATIKSEEELLLRFKRLYFPGWQLTINKEQQPILFEQEGDGGIIYAKVSKGENHLVLEFKNTLPRILGNLTSLIFVLLLIINIRKPFSLKNKSLK